ncbi:MAG: anthranilate phosphoribosyltransferase [Phycisphaeraceae bacterium]|nr:anthranilate phosphoribosyltransferase [Phycisphaeraceae bacterium]
MKAILNTLLSGKTLGQAEATEAFEMIMSGQGTSAQIAAFLAMIQLRGVTPDELIGAASVMRQHVIGVTVPDGLTAVDTCGTGGDHGGTFNVSTAAALVVAGAGRDKGVVVAKHGNRSVTSSSGSSQVLEALGVKLDVPVDVLTHCLDRAGICFCLASSHHPAMRHVMPTRLELGIRTMFNVLGPLTNPAGVKRQLLGVYAADLTETLAQVLGGLGAQHAMVVHARTSEGGLDELSTSGITRISEWVDGRLRTWDLDPASLGFAPAPRSALRVDSPTASAAVIREVLEGQHGPARDMVVLNSAAACVVAGLAGSLPDAVPLAEASIDSGAARQALDRLVEASHQA